MAEGKKSFLLYCDLIHTVRKMPNEKAGELLKHILEYVNDTKPETEDLLLQLVFEPIKQQLKRDLNKWNDISTTRSEIGRLAGIKSGEARRSKANQTEPNEPIGSETNQNEHVSDSVNEKGRENKSVFTPPTFIDFEIYCKGNGFQNIAERAFKGYSENNWKDSKGNKVLNWKSKLQNVWFDDKNKDNQNSEKLIRCIRKDHMGRCEVEITMAKIEQLRKNGTYVEIL